MENRDVIREKLDIKLVILFVLRRMPEACEAELLGRLILDEAGIGYFEYAECLSELIETGHVSQQLSRFRITEKGDRNCSIVESSLPYTVRSRLAKLLEPIAADMRRQALIKTDHEVREDGCYVNLAFSDGVSKIAELRLLCSGEEQAKRMEAAFRADPERSYMDVIRLLDPETV